MRIVAKMFSHQLIVNVALYLFIYRRASYFVWSFDPMHFATAWLGHLTTHRLAWLHVGAICFSAIFRSIYFVILK